MKFPTWLKVFGDQSFRDECHQETNEQLAFFSIMKREYPQYHAIAIHPKNEGKRAKAQFHQLAMDKKLGLTPGSSDIIIPALVPFVCELKRRDHTKSHWQDGQQEYLLAAHELGAFCCVALGHEGALLALKEWEQVNKQAMEIMKQHQHKEQNK